MTAPTDISFRIRANPDKSIEVSLNEAAPIKIGLAQVPNFIDTVPVMALREVLKSMVEAARIKPGEWMTMSSAPTPEQKP